MAAARFTGFQATNLGLAIEEVISDARDDYSY